MSHTQGKLKTNGPEIYREDGTQVCFIEPVHPFEECATDARRLVACWNACNRVETEDIEELLQITDDPLVGLISEVARLSSERDGLVNALREFYAEVLGEFSYYPDPHGIEAILAKYPEKP